MKRKSVYIILITFFGFLSFSILNSTKIFAATCNWVGGSSSDWSDSANWSGCIVPADGDDVSIPVNISTNNDISGLDLNSLDFSGFSAGGTLSGNDLTIDTAITSFFPHSINVAITLGGDVSLSTNSYNNGVDLNGHILTVGGGVRPWGISSQISGSGTITATDSGDIYLNGGGAVGTRDINAIGDTQIYISGLWSLGTSVHLTNGAAIFGPVHTNINVDTDGTAKFTPSRLGVGSPELQGFNNIDLNSGDTVELLLSGALQGTEYDSLITAGAIDLTGVNLNLSLTYSPTNATTFTIMHSNVGITGEFNSRPDGFQINLNGRNYTINYTATDVILTAQSGSCTWNGSASQFWSNSLNWDAGCSGAGGIPGNLDDIFFDGNSNTSNLNDIAGLTLNSIDFLAPNFIVVGLPLGINNHIGSTNKAIISNDLTIEQPFVVLAANDYGGIINYGSNDFTIDSTLNNMAIGSEFIGNGHVTFSGNNQIVLTGDSPNFNGLNNISGPDVFIEANMQHTAWLVGANSSINGNGYVDNVNVQASGVISARDHNSNPTIFHIGNLNLDSNATVRIYVMGNTVGVSGGYSQLQLTGTAHLNNSIPQFISGGTITLNDILIFIQGDIDGSFSVFIEGFQDNFGATMAMHYTDNQFGIRSPSLILFNPSFTTNPSSPKPGQAFVVTSTWTGNGSVPTGTAELFDGSTSLGVVTLVGGVATFNIAGLPEGTHSLTVQYPGDFSYEGAVSNALVLSISTSNLANTGINLPVNLIIVILFLSGIGIFVLGKKYNEK